MNQENFTTLQTNDPHVAGYDAYTIGYEDAYVDSNMGNPYPNGTSENMWWFTGYQRALRDMLKDADDFFNQ